MWVRFYYVKKLKENWKRDITIGIRATILPTCGSKSNLCSGEKRLEATLQEASNKIRENKMTGQEEEQENEWRHTKTWTNDTIAPSNALEYE